jgi:outer membrane protein TolC
MKYPALKFKIITTVTVFINLLFICSGTSGQNISLTPEYLYGKAVANYPLVKQYGLIEQSRDYTVSNASKGYLPQLSLSARATYQSDVTQIPVSIPGVSPMNKDQYQTILELSQLIWDGGQISAGKKMAEASSEIENKKNETDLYNLKDRVNQLFFGILLIEEQRAMLQLLQDDLEQNFNKVKAYVNNGVATKSDIDAIRVEQLKTDQRMEELKMNSLAYRRMLYALTGEEALLTDKLVKPLIPGMPDVREINRPELKLFDAQTNLYTIQERGIKALSMPKFSLFLQGGYGNPGLNMLKNEFVPYYIGGVRLLWNFGAYYTQKNSLRELENSRQRVNLQKESFLFNSNMEIIREQNEIEKLAKQLAADQEIISLRSGIKRAAEAKFENGTLQVSDLIREINAENLALQEKTLHEIQHLLAIYNLKNTLNK